MTNKELIEAQHKQRTEFEILFVMDDRPTWDVVKVLALDEEGCIINFTRTSPGDVRAVALGKVLGDVIQYKWDELTEDHVELKEIWV